VTVARAIAFLRALNVGGHTVKMDALRDLFAEMDFTNVTTYIASGNVLFDAEASDVAALERRIEAHLRAALGYEVATFIRSPDEVAAVAECRPFDADKTARAFSVMVAFLKSSPDQTGRERLMGYRRPSDDFAVHGREVYWLRRTQQSETNFSGATLERALGGPATVRSITTVRKLAALSWATR
jgi:uncharacterized protein (DUF1697 family)